MKHISILVPEGEGNLSSIVGSYKILTRANEYYRSRKGKTLYKIQVVGTSKVVGFYNGLFSVRPHTLTQSVKKTDLIIIPSLNHDYDKIVSKNAMAAAWIARQYDRGAELASICTGAFLLASTGLLDGKECSTHFLAEESLSRTFPMVRLKPGEVITYEDGIYTNGGAFSFLNLLIHLVEKYFDRPTALYCSKVFQVDMERQSQGQFSIFNGQKQHGDEVVSRAQHFIEKNISGKLSMEDLSEQLHVSRRNFDRRFIKATGNTPSEYAQRVKMEAVKKYLESTRKTINEVMYEVGYADQKSFRDVFKKMTGLSPIAYKQRFGKN